MDVRSREQRTIALFSKKTANKGRYKLFIRETEPGFRIGMDLFLSCCLTCWQFKRPVDFVFGIQGVKKYDTEISCHPFLP